MRNSDERAVVKQPTDAGLQVEIVHLTFRGQASTAASSGIGVIGATGLLAYRFSDPWLWNLTFVMVLVCGFRLALPIAFKRRHDAELTQTAANRWLLAYGVATGLNCITVAGSTLHNFRYHGYMAQLICTLGTFSLCTGMSERFGLPPWMMQFFGLISLSALGFSVYHTDDPILAKTGCAIIALFAAVFCKLVANKNEIVMEQLRLKQQMSHLAEHDMLTGLANRRQFEARLATLCQESGTMAIFFLDLDGFKKVNDTYGHGVGDALLQQVATRLRCILHPADLVARLGGDEFAILHGPGATAASAEALAALTLETVATPFEIEGHEIRIGIQFSIPGKLSPSRLLSQADEALYRVKQAGKGSFCFATSGEVLLPV